MTYRFDECTLDSSTRRLLRGEQEVHLSPKAFDLLTLLVENASRAVPKAELQQKLWPSTYVQETNLATLVAEIRRALGDPADDPRYVRTMHRFGYWFVGSVSTGRAAPVEKPPVRYWLVWEKRQIPLTEARTVLGRAPDVEAWIEAPGVSRHHARITLQGSHATLEDLGSKNGTYLRGERLSEPVSLSDGDQIRLGSVVITFRRPPPAASTETVRT